MTRTSSRTRHAAAFLAAMLAAQGVSGAPQGQPDRMGSVSRNVVAVIPFANITGVTADDWIGAGIAETITSDLRTIDGLAIIGRESILDALRSRGGGDPTEPDGRVALHIGRRIGATWLISGGYQHANGVIRITARVIEVATGTVVRSVKIDGARADIFGAQDRVAGELRGGLAAALAASQVAGRGGREPAAPAAQISDGMPPARPAKGSDVAVLPKPGHPAASLPVASPVAASPAGPAAIAPAPGRGVGASPAASGNASLASVDGPRSPVAPDVITRDDKGHATVRAVRTREPIRIDGRLDEEAYDRVAAFGGFLQQEPHEGELATEQTDAWIFFDDRNLYVSARCYDSHPEREVVNELRRDSNNIVQNDNLTVVLDTFYDRRNGFYFQTSPLGAIRDAVFTDEGNQNDSWNTIWDVKARRFEGGWTMEMAIPFKSLRYRGAGPQVWGINFRRIVRWKNETSYLTRVPAAYGRAGVFRVSSAGSLVGVETPSQSMNLEVKPYVVSSLTTDRTTAVPFDNRIDRNVGFDFKYGLTRSLIADATYNTDFAQVEEDVQQVNLTRFSLFFPEKREFFLEGQGLFVFGSGSRPRGGGGGGGVLARRGGGVGRDVPILFFSRRIGLSDGQSVPVVAGGRLTGKVGRFGLGALNIQTDDKPLAGAVATNFSVVRLKRDVLRRSNIGVLATSRTPTAGTPASDLTLGADANMLFFENLAVNSYYARTRSPGRAGDQSSYRGQFDYSGDRYGLQLEHLLVGDGFNPEVGFLRRSDFRRSSFGARFSPRPKSSRLIRKFGWDVSYDYITNARRTLVENRETQGGFNIEFNNSDRWNVRYTREFEYLPQSFEIAPGVILPVGAYTYEFVRSAYTLGTNRRVSGRLSASNGTFYGGHRTEIEYIGRIGLGARLNFEPGIMLNWVDLPEGDFKTRLVTTRAIVTPSPRVFISGLFQYNASAHTLNSSVRLRWEYRSGSDLFLVYSDGRNTSLRAPDILNRSVALKLTRLLRF